jgi:uncharacterized protein with PIN domain
MQSTYGELACLNLQVEDRRCPVCGSPMYITHHFNEEVTIHCAAPEAKFWQCPKGSLAEALARKHWDISKQDLYILKITHKFE